MADAREIIGAALDSHATEEKLQTLIARIVDLEATYSITCPRCKSQYKHAFPAIDKQAKAIAELLTQSKGAPKQTLEVTAPKHLEELRELDDEKLAALWGAEA